MHCTAEGNYCKGFTPVHLLSPSQSLPVKHTRAHTCIRQSVLQGQRLNNAEVVVSGSSSPSPLLLLSFSPSLSNKEAMLPWRQWSPGAAAANHSLSCVEQPANGCPCLCCCCHRHCAVIGRALLFDWISDLVFVGGKKNTLRSTTCLETYRKCLF